MQIYGVVLDLYSGGPGGKALQPNGVESFNFLKMGRSRTVELLTTTSHVSGGGRVEMVQIFNGVEKVDLH